jgi:hypothetical protein
VRYGDEMVACHQEEYDWRRSDVDVGALYSNGGGKKHDRFSMLNDITDTSGALSEARSSQSSRSSQGYETESRLQEEIRQHREGMQRQEEWARQQHEYMQDFFAQQRQLQVQYKLIFFKSLCTFHSIRYLIYYRFLGNVSCYPWITI